jgi:hypothetical protein
MEAFVSLCESFGISREYFYNCCLKYDHRISYFNNFDETYDYQLDEMVKLVENKICVDSYAIEVLENNTKRKLIREDILEYFSNFNLKNVKVLNRYIKNNIYCLEHEFFLGNGTLDQKIENWKVLYVAFILMKNLQYEEYAIALDKIILSKREKYKNQYVPLVMSKEKTELVEQFYKAQLEVVVGCDLITINN